MFALLATASVESDDENKIDLVIADSDTELEAISDVVSDTESEDIHVDRLDAIVHTHLVGIITIIFTCFENSFLYKFAKGFTYRPSTPWHHGSPVHVVLYLNR